jgi:peptidoglycan-N-acetylglucosamine deacetylase
MTYRKTNIFFGIVLIFLIVIDWQLGTPFCFYFLLIGIYFLINLWGTLFISSQFFISAKCRGDKTTSAIALTFDDGPVEGNTLSVLKILKQHEVKATFFCIGKNVKVFPELTKQIIQEGHLIGNHSFFHGSLFDLQSSKNMADELRTTNSVIQEATGLVPRFFRPPYGVTNPMLAKALNKMNFITVGWSIRSFDTISKSKDGLLDRITRNLSGGDIILLHDRCDITVEILPELLTRIKKLGLGIEPLDKLLKENAYA